jgi:protein-tyrosine phosphatase
MKVLMVCLGNICRSPMADGLLRKKMIDHQIDGSVDSAGTIGLHAGGAPDARMQSTAKSHGYPIDDLIARQFVLEDFDRFDVIYVMDKNNFIDILKIARNEQDKQKIHLILNESFPKKDREVPDPYFGGIQGFEDVFKLLDDATSHIIEKIKK